jgi:hypothetical protein
MIKIHEQWEESIKKNIRYADQKFIIKQDIVGIRLPYYLRFNSLKDLISYGFLPPRSVYLEFIDYAVIQTCQASKTLLKIIKEEALEYSIKNASSKHIHDFIKRTQQEKFVKLMGLFLISLFLFIMSLFWLDLPLGILYLW